MSLRKEFILKLIEKEAPVTELCRRYGISRKTAYKWLDRFRAKGIAGLVDESRRPDSSPTELSVAVTAEILRLRKAHWSWGARKIHRLLVRQVGDEAPSVSSITRVLDRHGLVRRKRQRPGPRKMPPVEKPSPIVRQPNDLWTVDFKGWWRAGDGEKCEPLTVRDAFSRFLLAVRLLPNAKTEWVRNVFEELFDEYGVPRAIQSDNGPPFASRAALGGISRLSAWWVSLGIELVHSRPGCPQDNGGHERMHCDIAIEIQARAAETRAEQQRVCDDWRAEFNHVRPHEALGMKTPAEVYRRSSRQPIVRALGMLPHGCELRAVDARGYVEWKARRVYVTCGVAGHTVGLRRQENLAEVWFHHMLIGTIRDGDISVQPVMRAAAATISNGAGDAPSALHVDSSADGPAHKDAPAPEPALAGRSQSASEDRVTG